MFNSKQRISLLWLFEPTDRELSLDDIFALHTIRVYKYNIIDWAQGLFVSPVNAALNLRISFILC